MAIELLSPQEIDRMRQAGRVAAQTLAMVGPRLRAGLSTQDIDRWVRADTADRGAAPSQLGYHGFPAAVCTSKNEVACHGIPHPNVRLNAGDILSVDVTSNLAGYHGDTCATFFIGEPSVKARHLVDVARRCRALGIETIRPGVRLGDIGAVIETYARQQGCHVITQVGGHGIGRKMHMDPHITYTGPAGTGLRLRAGMALTIEPILTWGRPELVEDDDGWTLFMADGSWAAQFEHTVLVTATGAEVLTTVDGSV